LLAACRGRVVELAKETSGFQDVVRIRELLDFHGRHPLVNDQHHVNVALWCWRYGTPPTKVSWMDAIHTPYLDAIMNDACDLLPDPSISLDPTLSVCEYYERTLSDRRHIQRQCEQAIALVRGRLVDVHAAQSTPQHS